MAAKREIVRREDRIGLSSGPELSNRQRSMLTALTRRSLGRRPDARRRSRNSPNGTAITLKDLEPLVQVAVDEGQLVRLSPQMVIDREALESLRQRLVEHFSKSPTAKVGEIREQWGITRKHAVPIFEFFDECQITSRDGDLRSAGPRFRYRSTRRSRES